MFPEVLQQNYIIGLVRKFFFLYFNTNFNTKKLSDQPNIFRKMIEQMFLEKNRLVEFRAECFRLITSNNLRGLKSVLHCFTILFAKVTICFFF